MNGFEFISIPDSTKRTTHVVALGDGHIAIRYTDETGTQLTKEWNYSANNNELPVGEAPIGTELPLQHPTVKSQMGNYTWKIAYWYDSTAPSSTYFMERWPTPPAGPYPHYILWPEGESQAPLEAATVVNTEPSNSLFAQAFKTTVKSFAELFEKIFNPQWAALASRDRVTDTAATDNLSIQEVQRQNNTDEWSRAYIGLCAAALWYLGHNVAQHFDGLPYPLSTTTLKDLVTMAETELHTLGIREWYYQHPVDSWTTALDSFQLYSTGDTWEPDTLVFTAPAAEQWKELKTRWYWAALFGKYPEQATLTLTDSPTVGDTVAIIGAGELEQPTWQWETSTDNVTWTELAGEVNTIHTPATAGSYIRCVAHYVEAGFTLVSVTNSLQVG